MNKVKPLSDFKWLNWPLAGVVYGFIAIIIVVFGACFMFYTPMRLRIDTVVL